MFGNQNKEVSLMCNNAQSGICAFGNSWWWIIVLIIVLVVWGGGNNCCGNHNDCGCGC